MKVRDRMTTNPYTVAPESSIGEVWRLMREHKHTHLPVVDHRKVVGMVTLKDFGTRPYFECIATNAATHFLCSDQEKVLNKVKVLDIMPPERGVVTIGPDAYIEQAAKLMVGNNLSAVSVVDDNGDLLGIITQTDIMATFLELLEIQSHGARINLRVDDDPSSLCAISQILSNHHVKIENVMTMRINGDKPLMALRINSADLKPIVNELKLAGFEVESTIFKQ